MNNSWRYLQRRVHTCSAKCTIVQNKTNTSFTSVQSPTFLGLSSPFPVHCAQRKLYENKTVNIDSLLTVYRIAGNIGDL